jgi:glycosyltransferase involved in cell wall biosynthesis
MLSILIPVYNYDVKALVNELHQQAVVADIPFEIIVLEDGPTPLSNANSSISQLNGCTHIVLPQNVGRSAARNQLADKAIYDHLLFMDCDAEVVSSQFVSRYLPFCKDEVIVIGGTAYDIKENRPEFSLRLKYGRLRESREARVRGKNNFATFNFLISKSIFDRVRFDESIKGYGHEDMLFGHALHQLGHEFIHIDNQLIHKGLDTNEVYLSKTEEATRNLFILYKTGKYPFLSEESQLLSMYLKLNILSKIFSFTFALIQPIFKKQLCSKNPSLRVYDIYKLLYLFKIANQ